MLLLMLTADVDGALLPLESKFFFHHDYITLGISFLALLLLLQCLSYCYFSQLCPYPIWMVLFQHTNKSKKGCVVTDFGLTLFTGVFMSQIQLTDGQKVNINSLTLGLHFDQYTIGIYN